jgi:hypothetical protein
MAIYNVYGVVPIGNPTLGSCQYTGMILSSDGATASLDFTTDYPGLTAAIKASNLRSSIREAVVTALAAQSVVVGPGDDVILHGDVVGLDL